ncbi:MAG: ribose 5-phosphate isomerase B [Candidatus Woesearchaeota archaeon]|nr:ribose 5-phosphate isomerase B [Candidatus Woesearchaeota archaeon]
MEQDKKIYIGSDHAGFKSKEKIKKILTKLNYEYVDMGPNNDERSVDYPLFAAKVAKAVLKNESKGILICGSGTGMQIAANKIKGIRAAFSYDSYSAKMARQDNDANILTLRGRKFPSLKYKSIVKAFLETKFSGEERHQRRIEQLSKLEME